MLDDELRTRASAGHVQRKPLLLRRTVAAVIDLVICLGLIILGWRYQSFATPDATGNYGSPGCVLLLASVLFWLAYFAGSESVFGCTLGKAVAGIKVVLSNGGRPDLGACIKRHLLDFIELQLFGLPAFIAVMLTPSHQRLGDLWAGTFVVLDQTDASAPGVPTP